jgi:hypothetical protein
MRILVVEDDRRMAPPFVLLPDMPVLPPGTAPT